MKMFLELLKDYGVQHIILGDDVDVKIGKDFSTSYCDDVRSAAFTAFGKSKLGEPVVLLINGAYLSSVYTVLTEAWFQKTNLIVVALYDSIYDVETNYLNRCTVANMKLYEKDYELFSSKIEESLNMIGPKVFNVVTTKMNVKENDYQKIIVELSKIMKKDDQLITYNSLASDSEYKFVFKNILPKYKYGTLSKYFAMMTELESKIILLCDDSCVKVDSNIFNSRYISKNLKIIILQKSDSFDVKEWISANHIQFIESKNLKNDIKDLYDSKEPTVLLVKDGE